MLKTTIIDYGVGNLFSVSKAFEKATDSDIEISSDESEIMKSDLLVLPGVGAFGKAMQQLEARKLVEPIKKFAHSGKPIFGICLGMQLLATKSYEFGEHLGLNLIPGEVKKMKLLDNNQKRIKIPFIGWSKTIINHNNKENIDFIRGSDNKSMYTVHSYQFFTDESSHELGCYSYGNTTIASVVKNKNIFGVQFHPEKSGESGLKLIKSTFQELTK